MEPERRRRFQMPRSAILCTPYFWINATELRWICSSGFLIELDPIGRILEGHQRNMLECFNYLREGRKPIHDSPKEGVERAERVKGKLSLKSYKTAACRPLLACPSQLTVTKACCAFLHACSRVVATVVENCAVARTSPLAISPASIEGERCRLLLQKGEKVRTSSGQ